MKRQVRLSVVSCVFVLMMSAGLARAEQPSAPAAASKPAGKTIKGECTFGRKTSTFTGTLTPTDKAGEYDAAYTAIWGGKQLSYKGKVRLGADGTIAGTGGNSNGTFEFSGKFVKNVAQCPYNEVGGKRNRKGSLKLMLE